MKAGSAIIRGVKRVILTLTLLAVVLALPALAQARTTGIPATRFGGMSVPTRAVYSSAAPRSASSSLVVDPTSQVVTPAAATATFSVTYHGFAADPAAKAAFQAAVDTWAASIVSTQVIHVDASWSHLGSTSGLLGSAGPTSFWLRNDNRVYPVALAEALCSCEKSSGAEISAEFNEDFTAWYKGTDGNVPNNKWDFYSVVLHELGHGLGFMSSFGISGGKGWWGFTNDNVTYYPLRFDANEWSAASGGAQMTTFDNGSTTLAGQLVDGSVYLGGTNIESVLGHRARLYAPNPWQSGSSNSHLDETAFASGTQNALMTPALNNGEAIHAPGPATLAIFRDIGWTTVDGSSAAEPGPPTNVSAVADDASAQVSWQAPADDGGAQITGYTAKSSPGGKTCSTDGTTSCTVTGLTNGTSYTFTVTAANSVGPGPASNPSNPVTPSANADLVAPIVDVPSVTVAADQNLATTALVHVTWPPASDTSGIAAYELQRKKGSGAWTNVALAAPTDTVADVQVKPGAKYRFRVRATDGVGNVGPWTTIGPAKLALLQESAAAVSYGGTWKTASLSGASGGRVRYAGGAGRTATLSFNGTSVAFVSTRSTSRGVAEIRLDGSLVASVDLYSLVTNKAAVVWAPPGALSAGAHTLQVRVTGTRSPSSSRTRVDVDAFLVWP